MAIPNGSQPDGESTTQPNGSIAHHNDPSRKKVAIIGSGCAAMGALYGLKDTDHEIHIFEKESRLGGHTNTRIWTSPSGQTTPVDTGFIVMNTATYPNFINFLKDVNVPTEATEMSFGVSRNAGEFEWSGSAKGVFAQRRNIFKLRHWRLIFDIVRFNQFALDLLSVPDDASSNITIGQYLNQEGYSQAFKDDYLIPMTAAVWSTSPDKASLEFPAKTLVRFMWNHHLLSTVARRPDWLTIPGGSQQYIDAILKSYRSGRLVTHKSTQVFGLARPGSTKRGESLRLHFTSPNGTNNNQVQTDTFDHVIFACHGDQIFPILSGDLNESHDGSVLFRDLSHKHIPDVPMPGIEEYEIFGKFRTTSNVCYLHSDLSLMPQRRDTWSSWNYLIKSQPSQKRHPAGVSLTYNMNILQHISTKTYGDVLVTMNPPHAPAAHLTQGQYTYEHPLYTVEAVRAQEKLESLQNKNGVSYCGAWTKYGFHEDGFSSGLKVAIEHLGGEVPFEFVDSTYSRGQKPDILLLDHLVRIVVSAILFFVRVGERMLTIPGVGQLISIATFLPLLILEVLEESGVIA